MSTLLRWLRFGFVGASGTAVQLTTLAALDHVNRGHYLVASAIAVELAVLNNFVWHARYTWKDRYQVRAGQCS